MFMIMFTIISTNQHRLYRHLLILLLLPRRRRLPATTGSVTLRMELLLLQWSAIWKNCRDNPF